MMPRLRRDGLHLTMRAVALSILTFLIAMIGIKTPIPYLDEEIEGVATTASILALIALVPGVTFTVILGWLSWDAWAELFRHDAAVQRAERLAARRDARRRRRMRAR